MRVRMRFQISGTRNGVTWPAPGGEVTLPDSEAVDLLNLGMAEAVKDAPNTETAAAKPKAEQADKPAPRPRGRPRKTPVKK